MEEKERVMGPIVRRCLSYVILIVAMLSVDLLYGYLLSPADESTQIGLHVLAVVLVFWLAATLQAWHFKRQAARHDSLRPDSQAVEKV